MEDEVTLFSTLCNMKFACSKRFVLAKIINSLNNRSISMISKSKSKKGREKKERINITKISYFGFKNLKN